MSDLSLKKETPESFYLSPKEAGILVGYTADYVSKLSRDGEIVAKRDGRNWLVEGSSLKAFAAKVAVEEKKRLEALKEERAKAYKASRDFLPLREAGLLFGYTPDYLAKLCRDGSVQAERDGREWFVERASLEEFATKIKLGETVRLESLRDARTQEYQKGKTGLFSVFKKKNGASRYPIFASTALGLGVFFLIFFFSYGFLFSGIDFENLARIFRPAPFVAVQNPVATSTPSTKTEPVAMVTNYNTYNNTYNNTTNEYNSQTIEGMSSADLAIELQGFKNTVLSQVYGAISNISSNVAGNTHAIQLTNRIDQLASVNISGSTFTGGSIANSTITNSNISGGTGSFTTLSVSGDTTLATTTITGPFTLTSTATSTFANGLNLSSGCFSINGVCLSTTGGGSSSGGTWSTTTSSVTGQFVNYSTNSTDIVAIGGSATTSAKYWFDPNTQISYISGSIGIGTTSPFARFSLAGANGSTSNIFAISTSTASATTTALTIDSGGNLSLLNGANASISGVLTLARALGIGSGGTGTSTAPSYGQFLVGNATGGYDYVATSTLGSASGVTSLAHTYGSTQTGAITFATSSDTNLLFNVTNSGGAFTFTPAWTGTLASTRLNSNVVQGVTNDTNITGSISAQNLTLGWTGQLGATRGGTGLSSIASSSLLIGGPGNTFIGYATSSLGIALSDTTGTLGVSRGGTGASTYSYGLIYSPGGTTALANIATSSLGLLTTDVLEGSNLYYTNARADARINATSTIGTLTSAPSLGTISTALTGILKATAGVLSTATAGTDYQAPITATYPIQFSANNLSLAFGTTTSNTWAGTQTFTNAPILGALTGVLYGNNGTLATQATTSLALSSAFSHSGTLGTLIGGSSGTLSLATNGVALTNIAQIAGNSLLGNSTGALGNVTALATSTLGIALGDTTGTLSEIRGGTNQISYTLGDTLYASAANTLARLGIGSGGQVLSVQNGIPSWVATSTLSTISGTLSTSQGGTGVNASAWSGIFGINNGTVYNAATTTYSSGLTYSAGNVTNTGVLSNIAGTGINVSGATGNVTISNAGLLSLQQTGGGSAQTGAITFATTSTAFNGLTANLAITNSGGAFTFAPTLSGTLGVGGGGTGSTSFGQGWIYSDGGTNALLASTSPTINYVTATSTTATSTFPLLGVTSVNISNRLTGAGLTSCSGSADKLLWNATTGQFTCGTDAGAGGGITAIGAQYSTLQTGSSQTFATSTDTNIGLNISSSGDIHTFTPTWSGTLGVSRGGTGASTYSYGLIYSPGGTTALANIATSSLGLLTTNVAEGSNLYYTDSRVNTYINASTTIPKTYTTNTFTGANTFNGVFTLGTLNGPLQANNGVVSATTSIGTTYGGTGLTAYTLGDTLYASATNVLSRLGIGSGGQVLSVQNGIPSWVATSTLSTISGTLSTSQGGTGVNASAYTGIFGINNGTVYNAATTTYSSGLAYSGGNVTNTGVLSNIAGTGINVSGATGNVTISNAGLLSLQQTGGGSAQTGAITFATSSDTNLLFNVTNSGGAFTFTPAWTGTLASTRLNSNVVQGVTNDTNITGSISAQNLTLGWTGTLATTRGGTGWAAVQASALLYGNGTGALATTTAGTNGQVLAYLNGIPTWTASTTLGTITGTLGIANGGTATTTFYNGGVTFYNSSLGTLSQAGDGKGLFWDETNKRLGVGTTTPVAPLSVTGSASVQAELVGNASYLDIRRSSYVSGSDGFRFGVSSSNVHEIKTLGLSDILIGTNNTERLRVSGSTGNIGIGTTSPYAKLSVVGQVVGEYFTATSTSQASTFPYASSTQMTVNGPLYLSATTDYLIKTNGANLDFSIPNSSAGFFRFRDGTSGTVHMVIDESNSHVGIGSTTPYAKLSVKGDGTTTGVNFQTANSSDSPLFTILDSGAISATGAFTSSATSPNTLPYASTTALTVSGNTFLTGLSGPNGLAINASGQVYAAATSTLSTISGTLSTSQGGTGVNASAWSGIFGINNGTVYNAATTTYSSGLTYSAGNVTNTGVLSNIAGTGINVSGATGNVTISNAGLLSLQQTGGGSAQTGAITFATTSTAFNGLTANLAITNSGGAFTFAPTLSGTLGVGGGGTNATSQTTNGVNYFNGTSITSGTGLTFDGTKFSVGTTTPLGKLSLYGAGTGGTGDVALREFVTLGGFAPNIWFDDISVGADDYFVHVNDSKFTVGRDAGTSISDDFTLSAGNVGIGTTTPEYKLTTSGSLQTQALLYSTDVASYLMLADSGSSLVSAQGIGSSGNSLIFRANGGTRATITNAGNFGIATTTPGTLLSLGDTGANTINISATATSTFGSGLNIRTGCYAIGGNCLSLSTLSGTVPIANGGTATTTFYNGGVTFYNSTLGTLSQAGDGKGLFWDETNKKLGVGTSSPYAALSVEGSSALGNSALAGYFIATSTSATSTFAGGLAIETSGFVYDYSTNKVGIGTASPSKKFHVQTTASAPAGTPYSNTQVLITGQSTLGLGFHGDDTAVQQIVFGSESDDTGAFITYQQSTALLSVGTTVTNGELRFTSNTGSERARIDSAGDFGIGTTTPANKLEVDGAASALASFRGTSATDYRVEFYRTGTREGLLGWDSGILQLWATTDLTLGANGVEKARLTSAGNFGIGTTSPYAKLSVVGQVVASYFTATTSTASTFPYASTTALTVSGNTFLTGLSGPNGLAINSAGQVYAAATSTLSTISGTLGIANGGTATTTFYNGGVTFYNSTLGTLSQGTTQSDFFYDVANKKLGIGTSSPQALLHVNRHNDASIAFLASRSGSAPSGLGIDFNSGYTRVGSVADFRLFTGMTAEGSLSSATERLTILSASGRVGIGTASPSDPFEVKSSGNDEGIRLQGSGGNNLAWLHQQNTDAAILRMYDGGTENIRINSETSGASFFNAGNVGIGTTTPVSTLSVQGSAYTSGTSFFGGAITATSTFTTTATSPNTLPYASTTALTVSGNTFLTGLSGPNGLAINSAGQVYAAATSTLSTISGTLGIANGGTATTTFYNGGVTFYNSSLGTLSQAGDGKGLFWDETNKRLGVGTTTPVAPLSVTGSASVQAELVGNASYLDIRRSSYVSGSDGFRFGVSSSNVHEIKTLGLSDILIGTNNTERLRVSGSTGNIGIGTTTPGSLLSIAGDSYTSGFINTSQITGGYKFSGLLVGYASTTNGATIWGLQAGGNDATTTATVRGTTAFGYQALSGTSGATGNTAFGYNAAKVLTSGASNTAIGYQALLIATTSPGNTAIGYQALTGTADGNTFSSIGQNIAVGYQALNDLTTGYRNVAVGYGALDVSTTGLNQVAVGYNALGANTTGSINTAIGASALDANTTGNYNTAIGANALDSSTSGSNNVAIGYSASLQNLSATSTVVIGWRAGYGATTLANQGTVIIGYQAGRLLDAGSDYNTHIGYQAGYNVTTGNRNIYLGSWVTSTNANITTGSNNIIIGNEIQAPSATASNQLNIQNIIFGTGNSGTASTLSTGFIGIGTTTPATTLSVQGNGLFSGTLSASSITATSSISALFFNASQYGGFQQNSALLGYASTTNTATIWGLGAGGQNATTSATSRGTVAVGYQAFNALTSGANNTAVGYQAGYKVTDTGQNSFFGYEAGAYATTSSQNVAVGYRALKGNTSTFSATLPNTAIGYNALTANTSGGYNTAIGNSALAANTTGSQSVAIGTFALQSNTTGSNNAVGYNALGTCNGACGSNNAFGNAALQSLTTGQDNTAFGNSSQFRGTTAGANATFGYASLYTNKTGTDNIAFGNDALRYINNATNTVAIGSGAGADINQTNGTIQNNVFIGYKSGNTVTTGANNNIFLGYQAGNAVTTGASNILIGYDIDAQSGTGSNQLSLGNLIFGTGIDGTGTTVSSGNIGIGSSTPYAKLSVKGAGSTTGVNFQTTNSSNSPLVTVLDSGNVGIGTASPADRLSVAVPTGTIEIASFSKTQTTNDTGALLALWGGSTGDTVRGYLGFAHTGSGTDTTFTGELADALQLRSEGAFQLGTNGNNIRLTVATGGNVGIGEAVPGSKLSVSGNATIGASYDTTAAPTNGLLVEGNVGIGNTSPFADKLHVSLTSGQLVLFGGSGLGVTSGNYTGIGIGYAETGKTYLKSAIVQEQVGDGAARGTLHILNDGTNDNSTATLADARLSITYAGNVGIGTTTPENLLQVQGNGSFISSSNPYLRIADSALTNSSRKEMFVQYNTTGNYGRIDVYQQGVGAKALVLQDQGGNVGIGTTSPATKLDVNGYVMSNSGFRLNASDGSQGQWAVASGETYFDYLSGLHVRSLTGGTTERLTITSAGNVGIGTTSPAYPLDVYRSSAGAGLRVDAGVTGTNIAEFHRGSLSSNYIAAFSAPGGDAQLSFQETNAGTDWTIGVDTSNTDSFNISQGTAFGTNDFLSVAMTGRIGIASTSPWGLLSVNPNALGSGVPEFVVGSSTATHFIVTGAGNVGVGTASPGYKLDVNGDAQINGIWNFTSSGVFNWGSGYGYGTLTWDTGYAKVNAQGSNSLKLYSASSGGIDVTSAGNVGIGTTTPWGKLSVTNTGTGPSFIVEDSTSPDTTPFVVDSAGLVGIGFATPIIALDILATNGVPQTTNANLNTGISIAGSAGGPSLNLGTYNSGGVYYSWIQSAFHSSGSTVEPLILNQNGGSVGIGTTTPTSTELLSIAKDQDAVTSLQVANYNTGTAAQAQFVLRTDSGGGQIAAGSASNATWPDAFVVRSFSTTSNGLRLITGAGNISLEPAGNTVITSGNVGIGTSTPDAKLDILGSSGDQLRLRTAGSEYYRLGRNSSTGLMEFYGSQSGYTGYVFDGVDGERMRITPAGNVGIGTSTPYTKLGLTESAGASAAVAFADTDNTLLGIVGTARASNDLITGTVNTDMVVSQSYGGLTGSLIFGTGSTERMRVTATGNVGIGTTGPGALLDVSTAASSNPTFQLSDGDVAHGMTGILSTTATFKIQNYSSSDGGAWVTGASDAAGTPGMSLQGVIGVTDPTDTVAGLLLNGSKKNTTSEQAMGALETVLQVETGAMGSGTKLMTILGSGNVGIGTASPGSLLHVYKSTTSSLLEDGIRVSRPGVAGSYAYMTYANGSDRAYFGSVYSGGAKGNITLQVSDGSASIDALNISANGNVGIGDTSPDAKLDILQSSDVATQGLQISRSNDTDFMRMYMSSGLGGLSDTLIFSSAFAGDVAAIARDGSAYFAGKVGIGSTTPSAALSVGTVLAVSTVDTSANIFSVATSTGTSYFDITRTGNVGVGTTSPASTFTVTGSACFSGGSGSTVACGTTAGSIYYRSASTGTYDVAENYQTSDPTLSAGSIATLDLSQGTTITTATPNSIPLGIVSTDPGLTLGGADASADPLTRRPLALSGRVPVKVSTANGAIAIGDRLMLSTTTPGVAVKALHSGQTIGIALETYSASTLGTVETFVSSQYWLAPNDFAIDSTTGTMGIGTTTPTNTEGSNYRLAVGGDILATGFVNLSEGDSKADIQHISTSTAESFLDTIRGLMVAEYHYKNEPASAGRVGLIAEEAPQIVRSTKGNGIDLYKLLSVAVGGVQSLANKFDALVALVSELTARVVALENGSGVSGAVSGAVGNIAGALETALTSQSVSIANGTVTATTLAAHHFVATPNASGDAAAGSATIRAGETSVLVRNVLVAENSKVFVTFNSNTGNGWYVSNKTEGGFSVSLNAPLQTDASFDYFVVDLATSTPIFSTPSTLNPTPSLSGDSQAPTILINGNNPATINVGDSYADLGALVTDNVDQNLGITTLLDGVETLTVNLDTSVAGTHTVTYRAVDVAGNTASVERTVTVQPLTPPTPET